MKKKLVAIILAFALLLITGCSYSPVKYKRISFKSTSLSEEFEYLDENTTVVNNTNASFSAQLPIYAIAERGITDRERQLILDIFEFPTNPRMLEHDGNRLSISLVRQTDSSRGYFDMTEEEAIEQAWKLFKQIPFIEGEYECIGIRQRTTQSDKDGKHTLRAGVTFCRVLDGIRVTGDDSCTLTFDGSGLVGISMTLFEYTKVGTMDLVALEDAEARLKSPDDLDVGTWGEQPYKKVDILQVDRIAIRLINQYAKGCTILQPIYFFAGTATLEDNSTSEFSSKVIAIPEEMTYEE
jgi:hypothetical protein